MIRPARMADLPELNHLLQQILAVHHEVRPDIFKAVGQKFSAEELERLLANPQTPIFVYERDGKVVGHLFCEIREAKDAIFQPVKTLYIEDLCVDEAARGHQIGQELYQFAKGYAQKNGCYHLTLDVWNANKGAVQFYERLGLTAQKVRMEEIL